MTDSATTRDDQGSGDVVASMTWQRLDVPGRDSCRLRRLPSGAGWRLEGEATFVDEGAPAALRYQVDCDRAWRTTEAELRGTVGARTITVDFSHVGGTWRCNGAVVSGLDGCVDLDLGFTPATNLFQIRRVALAAGQGADVPVAWFDLASAGLERVAQRYERRSTDTYWYESPRFNYAALLEFDAVGFVLRYPDLWQAEVASASRG
jgi:hypothetical protein